MPLPLDLAGMHPQQSMVGKIGASPSSLPLRPVVNHETHRPLASLCLWVCVYLCVCVACDRCGRDHAKLRRVTSGAAKSSLGLDEPPQPASSPRGGQGLRSDRCERDYAKLPRVTSGAAKSSLGLATSHTSQYPPRGLPLASQVPLTAHADCPFFAWNKGRCHQVVACATPCAKPPPLVAGCGFVSPGLPAFRLVFPWLPNQKKPDETRKNTAK